MQKSRLIETLSNFDEEELKRFDRFVRSPFFHAQNNFRDEVLLFEYIQNSLLSSDLTSLDKKSAYHYIYPHASFVGGKLDKLMSRLFKSVRNFISVTYSNQVNNEVQTSLSIARFYRLKGMHKRFQDTIKSLRNSQKEVTRPDKEYYYNQLCIEEEISTYNSLNNRRKGDINLYSTLESLDLHYLIKKLEYTCGLLSQNVDVDLKLKHVHFFSEEIEKSFKTAAYLEVPIVQVFNQAIRLLQSTNDHETDHFGKFKSLLETHREVLPQRMMKAMQTIARNYCVVMYNNGVPRYLAETVSLYKEHLEQGLLYYQKKLIPNTIFNIVQLGLELEDYDWIKQFLEDHRNRITGTEYPEEVYRFNMASYYFSTKDFDQALDLLNDQYEDTYYNLAARRLEIKIYYEINSPLLVAKIDSFKVFIFRMSKKLLQEVHNTANNNFINILRQITNPKTKGNDKRIDKLIEKVKEESTISEKSWLLEKLEEMR